MMLAKNLPLEIKISSQIIFLFRQCQEKVLRTEKKHNRGEIVFPIFPTSKITQLIGTFFNDNCQKWRRQGARWIATMKNL